LERKVQRFAIQMAQGFFYETDFLVKKGKKPINGGTIFVY